MTAKRAELIRKFVLDVISDDYENLEKIETEVGEMAGRCGLFVGPAEILSALAHLVEDGLARAYRLSGWLPNQELAVMPAGDEIRDSYYWVTDAGMKLQMQECEFWPFDDENALRKDWFLRPPDAGRM